MDLPEYYRIWMEIAHDICHLIATHQLRNVVEKVRMMYMYKNCKKHSRALCVFFLIVLEFIVKRVKIVFIVLRTTSKQR